MRNAVLLVKNGIGFGHIRRALLVAEALHEAGRLRPTLISQACSLAMYRDCRVRVINLPLLHRVPSAIAEDFYTDLLDRLIHRLDPAVVIEDTYPDARYRSLRSLADRPRILIMRRLDGPSFDQIRQRGDLAHYDRILIAQDEDELDHEDHSGESLAAIRHGGRFAVVGNLAHVPSVEEQSAVRRAYGVADAPLVVVSGGAGGDQLPDGYGDRLFSTCEQIAAALAGEGHPARFVFVTGPYYAGRPLRQTGNVVIRRFEPRLPALLAAAEVAVIKPGNNALSEALSGRGQLVLVPDASFMEGLDGYAARIAVRYGGAVGKPERASLEPLIREALLRQARDARRVTSATALAEVMRAAHAQAYADSFHVPAKAVLLLLMAPQCVQADSLRAGLPEGLRAAVVVDAHPPEGGMARFSRLAELPPGAVTAVFLDRDPAGTTPQALVDRGVQLLVHDETAPQLGRWLNAQPSRPALLTLRAERTVARPGAPVAVERRLARLLAVQGRAAVMLDLGTLGGDELTRYLESLAGWIAGQPVRLASVSDATVEQADRLLWREA